MSKKYADYFCKTLPENYSFLGFYKYRCQQPDFTFSYQKESRKLSSDLEELTSEDSEVVRAYASRFFLVHTTTNQREKFPDVQMFWNNVESSVANSSLRLDKVKTARTIMNGPNERKREASPESTGVEDGLTEDSPTNDKTNSDLEITKNQDNDYEEEDTDSSLDAREQSPKRRKKIDIEKIRFFQLRSRNIYPLCKPFMELSKEDADGLFNVISDDTTVEFNLPEDVKEYVKELLIGDVESAFFKVEKSLKYDASPLLLWTREVCRHFLLYYRYGGLQHEGGEKTWSTQTVYRILDLFLIFFGKTISGIAFGEIPNEAHQLYPKTVKDATVLYEQSYGPTEFVLSHKLDDFIKLARNGVDDLNYHFTNNENCTTTTAKKLKSVGIHGYRYLISVYLTDIIRIKTYRVYEIFTFKIPISYSERWELLNVVRFGVLLEKLLTERRNIKTEMSMENVLKIDDSHCVRDWIKIPDNTPPKTQTQIKIPDNTPTTPRLRRKPATPSKTQTQKKIPYNTPLVTPPVTPSKTQTPVKSFKIPRSKRHQH
ncbi:hypothetical protein GLOIN_2v1604429 [Rhizophagus clarus]|uniref:Uncharacterized protein n=1 Tax=Rhizophagus clarus TaxID=94130 RepID=A0A8H3M2Q7_9GLOM|nr:hypothetical protein GLOIN_2v1604429 [Rhizophagus clarus]